MRRFTDALSLYSDIYPFAECASSSTGIRVPHSPISLVPMEGKPVKKLGAQQQ